MTQLYIARQPIFDRSLKLHGYELLYREEDSESVEITDADQATSQVISFGLVDIGLDDLVGSSLAYINLSRDYILGNQELPFPPDKMVVEIREDQLGDEDIDRAIEHLTSKSYRVALDGISTDRTPRLLPVAQAVKIDVSKTSEAELVSLVDTFKQQGIEVIAEKVEDSSQLNRLLEMDIDYLQGYFFSRPIILRHNSLSTNQMAMMKLLAIIYNPETSTEQLEDAISRDVTLSYHLLRYINSAFFNLTEKLESIKQAVVYMGRNTLKTWATVISMAGNNSNKPEELITLGLVRARLCESLALTRDDSKSDSYFSVGLLSILDALLDMPMGDVVDKLPLDDQLSNALVERAGDMGLALRCCEGLEQANWEQVQFNGISSAAINIQYRNAVQWADDVIRNMKI